MDLPSNARNLRAIVFSVSCGLFLAGCIGPSTKSLPDLPLNMDALASLSVSPPVSIIAVGSTQQLNTTATAFDGTSVTTFDSVLYRYSTASDSVFLRMSPAGLLTGIQPKNGTIFILIFGFRGDAVRGDVVLSAVTASPIAGLTMSIQPIAPDSAKLASGTTKSIIPVVRNPNTAVSIANLPMRYAVKGTDASRMDVFNPFMSLINGSDRFTIRGATINNFSSNQIRALSGEGTVWIYATMTAYGTPLQDSVQYTLSYPYTATIAVTKDNLEVVSLYAGQVITLAPGAVVTFQNGIASSDPLTVTYVFDNPAAALAASPPSTTGGSAGNVTTLTGGQNTRRQFATPGTYHWTMTGAGGPAPWAGQTLLGTIVIK